MKKNTENRFEKVYDKALSFIDNNCSIIVDNQTGVNYLVVYSSYGLGVTPLIDQNGKPIVGKVRE